MKRCPQCEFIYEDDQSLCDMDGILLVFDSQRLPKQTATGKSTLRSRIIPAIAVVVLTTVLALVYYVSTHQRRTIPTVVTNDLVQTPPPATSETQVASEKPEDKMEMPAAVPVAEAGPSVTKPQVSNEPKKPIRSKSSTTQKQKSNDSEENDSKIESFMKKTGRMLKKPFKF